MLEIISKEHRVNVIVCVYVCVFLKYTACFSILKLVNLEEKLLLLQII